jgi:hypothetical protein
LWISLFGISTFRDWFWQIVMRPSDYQ